MLIHHVIWVISYFNRSNSGANFSLLIGLCLYFFLSARASVSVDSLHEFSWTASKVMVNWTLFVFFFFVRRKSNSARRIKGEQIVKQTWNRWHIYMVSHIFALFSLIRFKFTKWSKSNNIHNEMNQKKTERRICSSEKR